MRLNAFNGVFILLGIAASMVVKNSIGYAIVLSLLLSLFAYQRSKGDSFADSCADSCADSRAASNSDTKRPLIMRLTPLNQWALLCFGVGFSALLLWTYTFWGTTEADISFRQHLAKLDTPLRYFIVPLFGLTLLSATQSRALSVPGLGWAFLCATITALLVALYERFYIGHTLVLGPTNHHILFGGAAAVVTACALLYPQRSPYLNYLGFACGATAVLLSTSRGSWPVLLLLPMLYGWIHRHRLGRQGVIMGGMACLAGILLYALPQTSVQARIDVAINDVVLYFTTEVYQTSLGLRFEMWKGALMIFRDHWLWGAGLEAFPAEIEALVAEGAIRSLLSPDIYRHAHNDLLNALANRGLVGGLLHLALLLLPAYHFARGLRHYRQLALQSRGSELGISSDAAVQSYQQSYQICAAGLSVVLCYGIAGLSESLLNRNMGVTGYLFFVTLFLVLLAQQARRSAGDWSADESSTHH